MVQMDWFFRHKRFFVVCLCVLVGLLLVVRLASLSCAMIGARTGATKRRCHFKFLRLA